MWAIIIGVLAYGVLAYGVLAYGVLAFLACCLIDLPINRHRRIQWRMNIIVAVVTVVGIMVTQLIGAYLWR